MLYYIIYLVAIVFETMAKVKLQTLGDTRGEGFLEIVYYDLVAHRVVEYPDHIMQRAVEYNDLITQKNFIDMLDNF